MQYVCYGNVYRDGQRRVAVIDPLLLPAADLIPDIKVEVIDQAALFQYGYKYVRGNDRAVGLDPSRQRFGADDFSCGRIALRLKVEGDFPALESM